MKRWFARIAVVTALVLSTSAFGGTAAHAGTWQLWGGFWPGDNPGCYETGYAGLYSSWDVFECRQDYYIPAWMYQELWVLKY